MSHVQHELAQKFPEKTARLHELKLNDAHYARLSEEYHALNRRIHRLEAEGSPRSDALMVELKAKRVTLLDELTAIING